MSKKILYTISFYLVFGLIYAEQIHAQNYIPMINDSLYWDVAYAVNDPHPCAGFGVGGPNRYSIGNDTIINGTLYKQMVGYDFLSFWPPDCPPFYVDTVLQTFDFYIREDTIAMKVFQYNTTSQLDELLFDFSLQQNDSIFLPANISPNIYFYVDTLYTIVTSDGISRKYFECFPRPNQGTTGGYYIEGLGGAMGPFERPYHLFEEGYWVLCICDFNESPIYGTTGLCYNFTTNTMQHEGNSSDLNVYPIPSTENIYVNNISLNASFTIINTLGEVMQFKKPLREPNINISKLNPGVYYIIFETDHKISAATFVKQ